MGVSKDRLSELPDGVIDLIFSKLDMREVVRTTVLSKRWVNLWTTVTSLDFYISNYETHMNFVNRVLECWNGTKIKFFRIKIRTFCYKRKPPYGDMGRWVNFAVDKNVEELHILNHVLTINSPNDPYDSLVCETFEDYFDDEVRDPNDVYDHVCFPPPQSLYSCSSVRELTLYGCDVQISSDVCLDQLKSLVVERGEFSGDTINRVVSGSPKLETLRMFHWRRPDNMNIHSTSLKTLVLDSRDQEISDELSILAPKLEGLNIKGCGYSKCLVKDTFSLTNVVLTLEEVEEEDDDEDENEDEDDKEEEKGKRGKVFRETLRQIIPAIQYAAAVELSWDCCRVLNHMPFEVPSFSKVKHLNVTAFPIHDLEDIAGILETFPNLERLIIRPYCANYDEDAEEDSTNLESLLLQLRTIDVQSRSYEDSLGFIVSLLKHATEVRKIVIRNIGDRMDESKYKEMVEKELPGLQSSFPKLEQILYQKCGFAWSQVYVFGDLQCFS